MSEPHRPYLKTESARQERPTSVPCACHCGEMVSRNESTMTRAKYVNDQHRRNAEKRRAERRAAYAAGVKSGVKGSRPPTKPYAEDRELRELFVMGYDDEKKRRAAR